MKKRNIMLITAVTVCAVTIVTAVKFSIGRIDRNNNIGGLLNESFYNIADYEEDLKKEDSDITGLTKYDKYKMGLDPSDGSDTDFDGITDKDEIEVYNTDPTKNSTSGDFYSDGYKLEHGMDFNTYYEYQNDLQITGNSCPEVTLIPESSYDFNAIVADYSQMSMYKLKDKEVIKTYSVHMFTGAITIDLTDTGYTASEVNVYVCDFSNNEANAVDFAVDGNKITLNEKFKVSRYVIYIVHEQQGDNNQKANIEFGSKNIDSVTKTNDAV